MKTLTYGTLPSFEEFSKAFKDADRGSTYTVSFNDSDFNMAANLDLLFEGTYHTTYASRTSAYRWDYEFTAEQLYALCEALCEVEARFQGPSFDGSEEQIAQADWALGFCSSILSTLGFEWV